MMDIEMPEENKFNDIKMSMGYIPSGILLLAGIIVTLLQAKAGVTQKVDKIKEDVTIINGLFPDFGTSDTVRLEIYGEFGMHGFGARVIHSCLTRTTNGKFLFTVPTLLNPSYFSLYHSSKKMIVRGKLIEIPVIEEYLIKPGDSIFIRSNLYEIAFSGNGALRLQSWHDLMVLKKNKELRIPSVKAYLSSFNDYHQKFNNADSVLDFLIKELNLYKSRISLEDLSLFKADIIGKSKVGVYKWIAERGLNISEDTLTDQVLKLYATRYFNVQEDTFESNSWILSPYYIDYLYHKTIADIKYKWLIEKKTMADMESPHLLLIEAVLQKYKGQLMEKLAVLGAVKLSSRAIIPPKLMADIESHITSTSYKKILLELRQTFGTDREIADFIYKDREGKAVSLSDFKGKVIFIDIWYTGCGACIYVANAMVEVEQAFKDNSNVVFLSISIDKDREIWLSSIKKYKSGSNNFPLAGKYYSGENSIYLYTDKRGSEDDFIRKYVPDNGYPKLMIIGKDFKMYSSVPPRPDREEGKLIALLHKAIDE